jgi:6-phosphofructokinase 1
MDNDILWVWPSFGFDTAVEQATSVINTLHGEAFSTRRIGLVELFGAESGFVAANAALASGRADLVLIPEIFKLLDQDSTTRYLNEIIDHIKQVVQSKPHNPHAIIVVAEGVGTILETKGFSLEGMNIRKETFLTQFKSFMENKIMDAHGRPMSVFSNQPRHYIRAVPANAHDQVYCERLGALAVDNALAGYTDFMISQWLNELVLVPLGLVKETQKCISIYGMFWKQIVSNTGQPLSEVECREQ